MAGFEVLEKVKDMFEGWQKKPPPHVKPQRGVSYPVYWVEEDEEGKVEIIDHIVGEEHVLQNQNRIETVILGEPGPKLEPSAERKKIVRARSMLPIHRHPALPEQIRAAEVGQTRTQRNRLIAHPESTTDDAAIVVWKMGFGFGFGGSNDFFGEHCGWKCVKPQCGERVETEPLLDPPTPLCAACGASYRPYYKDWPGHNLAEGRVARGEQGLMGHGRQLAALIPKEVIVTVIYRGERHGLPRERSFCFSGTDLTTLTWDERNRKRNKGQPPLGLV